MKIHLNYINKHLANNYKSRDIILNRGKNIYLYDINNKKYFDFLSGYSAINQGHCHPRLSKTINDQVNKLTLTSRSFHNNLISKYSHKITNLFGYDKVLPMNTGVEAGETAVKLARKWGYENKNIEKDKARVIFANNNFWGRTLSAISSSNDINATNNFGPFMSGFDNVEYNNFIDLEKQFQNKNICAFMVEPIQGEAGIIIPDDNYFKNVRKLCDKYNILLIMDEIQTGLGRTGKMLCSEYYNIKPDILILGKALSGGTIPISAILCNNHIMDNINPGQHGSTYGGNPLACRVAIEALNILLDENLIENSYNMGMIFRKELNLLDKKNIKNIRGKGLLNAIEFKEGVNTDKILDNLIENGILRNFTHNNTLRLSPPLTINKNELSQAIKLIEKSITV